MERRSPRATANGLCSRARGSISATAAPSPRACSLHEEELKQQEAHVLRPRAASARRNSRRGLCSCERLITARNAHRNKINKINKTGTEDWEGNESGLPGDHGVWGMTGRWLSWVLRSPSTPPATSLQTPASQSPTGGERTQQGKLSSLAEGLGDAVPPEGSLSVRPTPPPLSTARPLTPPGRSVLCSETIQVLRQVRGEWPSQVLPSGNRRCSDPSGDLRESWPCCLMLSRVPPLWPRGLQPTRLLCPPLSPGGRWPSTLTKQHGSRNRLGESPLHMRACTQPPPPPHADEQWDRTSQSESPLPLAGGGLAGSWTCPAPGGS